MNSKIEKKNLATSPVVDEENAQDILEDENVDYINLEFADEEDFEYACEWAEDLAILDAEGFSGDDDDLDLWNLDSFFNDLY